MGIILLCASFFCLGFIFGKNYHAVKYRLGIKHQAYVPVRHDKETFTVSNPWDELD